MISGIGLCRATPPGMPPRRRGCASVTPSVQHGNVIGVSNRLSQENIAPGSFETDYWNIENWVTVG